MGLHDARHFRRLHQRSGEQIRWWKAIPVTEGVAGRESNKRKYVEQTIDAAARFLVSNTSEDYESQSFGLMPKGTMQISAFPDWARFNHLDVIALIAVGRLQSAYVTPANLKRGAGTVDTFPWPHVASITNVWVAGEPVANTDYRATDAGIEWLDNAPAEGTAYAAEYLYQPRYLCLPQSERTSPTDRNGVSLPLRYWLTQELNTAN